MKSIYLMTLLSFMSSLHAETTVMELERRIEVLSEEMESIRNSGGQSKLKFGGYGEFVYANKRSTDESGSSVGHSDNPQWDALRWILYTGYDFSKKWRMQAEIEIEHADEIYLEQGLIEYNHSEAFNFNVGVMLIPVGITNIYHEPTTFLGVERPEIDSKIVPSTWRENGLGIYGKLNSLRYQLMLVNGLKATGFSSDGVRGGRQKASKAEARDLAWAGRVEYLFSTGYIGTSAYIGEAGGVLTDVSHQIIDLHAVFKVANLDFKAVWLTTSLGNTTELNNERSLTGSSAIASKMSGYYAEVGYNIFGTTKNAIIPFLRYESYNTQEEVDAGFSKDPSKERTNLTYGLNYNPLENLVFKGDYTAAKNMAKTGYDTWRLGLGWNF